MRVAHGLVVVGLYLDVRQGEVKPSSRVAIVVLALDFIERDFN